MTDLKVDGFKASEVISSLSSTFDQYSEEERNNQIKKTNGIFEFRVTNEANQEAIWSIDMKKTGKVYKGGTAHKADVVIILSDDTLTQLAAGTITGQKAFITGKLKTKGNLMLATRLDALLKGAKAKL